MLFFDGKNIPIKSGYIDSVICTQVFEHVFEPEIFLNEINRVLKKNGHLLLTLPFVWDKHKKPYDYSRYSSFGIKYLLEKKGFKIIQQYKTTKDFSLIAQ